MGWYCDTRPRVVPAGTASIFFRHNGAIKWKRTDKRWLRVDAGPGRRVDLIPEGEGYQVRMSLPNHRAPLHPEPLSLEDAQSLAEDWVRQQGGTRYAAKDAAWRHAPATPKQRALAERLGLALADGLSRGEAQVVLDDALAQARLHDPAAPWRAEPASSKQLAWLGAHHLAGSPRLVDAHDVFSGGPRHATPLRP